MIYGRTQQHVQFEGARSQHQWSVGNSLVRSIESALNAWHGWVRRFGSRPFLRALRRAGPVRMSAVARRCRWEVGQRRSAGTVESFKPITLLRTRGRSARTSWLSNAPGGPNSKGFGA